MSSRKLIFFSVLALVAQALCPLAAFNGCGQSAAADEGNASLLLSGRMELIQLYNFTEPVRQNTKEKSRFYFNNIFLNLEGGLGERAHFIAEFQPLTSDLYLLGGFLTIAEALEGIGLEDAGQREKDIANFIGNEIRELDADSEKTRFERAQISFYPSDHFGLHLGRVRNPFGFWDDYSLFRNLSALKTDPVTLGVALRRADLGAVAFGQWAGTSYHLGLLQGENAFRNKDSDNFKDLVIKIERNWGPLDLAGNLYLHNIGEDSEPSSARGLSYRYRASYNLTLLGEFLSMENEDIDISTRGFYIQSNYDLSDRLLDGLRWNMFFEYYDSTLLDIDLEPDLNYRFAGTYFYVSTGFVHAYNRNINLGANLTTGADEEGDHFYKLGFKIDAKF
jgi:hypothetical protein